MKHKTENTHKYIIKQQSDSSGVTAWLSMADWSSPVPGLSICYQHNKPHLCVRTQEVVSVQMWLSSLTITVGLQCMFLMDYSHSALSDKVVKLHFNFTHASCTGIIQTFVLNLFKLFLAYMKNHILWQLQAGILA